MTSEQRKQLELVAIAAKTGNDLLGIHSVQDFLAVLSPSAGGNFSSLELLDISSIHSFGTSLPSGWDFPSLIHLNMSNISLSNTRDQDFVPSGKAAALPKACRQQGASQLVDAADLLLLRKLRSFEFNV